MLKQTIFLGLLAYLVTETFGGHHGVYVPARTVYKGYASTYSGWGQIHKPILLPSPTYDGWGQETIPVIPPKSEGWGWPSPQPGWGQAPIGWDERPTGWGQPSTGWEEKPKGWGQPTKGWGSKTKTVLAKVIVTGVVEKDVANHPFVRSVPPKVLNNVWLNLPSDGQPGWSSPPPAPTIPPKNETSIDPCFGLEPECFTKKK